MSDIIRIKTITELSRIFGLEDPRHPLISIYYDEDLKEVRKNSEKKFFNVKLTSDFYLVLFKNNKTGSMVYGKTSYDFQNGTLVFIAPNQVTQSNEYEAIDNSGAWYLAFHPDLIRNTDIGSKMDKYSFFSYESNEALHLSVDEQDYLSSIIHQIEKEYSNNLDEHSHRLIISNLELLLNNCLRFYDRQFYTRSGFNKDFVSKFERLLKNYFDKNMTVSGLPTVSYFGKTLNLSPNYLSDLLKKETGKSAKDHINNFLIEKAKNALLLGVGIGAYPYDKNGYQIRFTTGYFYENETYNGDTFINSELINPQRINNSVWLHLTTKIPIAKRGSFDIDFWYFQSFKERGDYALSILPKLQMKINRHFSFMIRYDWRFENVYLEPLTDLNDLLLFGLNVKFGR